MNVVFTGLTDAQAKELAVWFMEQGEQDLDIWFDVAEVPAPLSTRSYEKDGNVIVECRTP